MLKIKITSAEKDRAAALAAARGVLRRFAATVDVNGKTYDELGAVLDAEANLKPEGGLMRAKAHYRAVKQRLMSLAVERALEEDPDLELTQGVDLTSQLSEAEYKELTDAQRDVDIARHARRRGQKPGSLVIDVPTARLGASAQRPASA